jgi:hypothetical protein
MAPKGSSVIQAMLKRLAEEEVQQKQNEAKMWSTQQGGPRQGPP